VLISFPFAFRRLIRERRGCDWHLYCTRQFHTRTCELPLNQQPRRLHSLNVKYRDLSSDTAAPYHALLQPKVAIAGFVSWSSCLPPVPKCPFLCLEGPATGNRRSYERNKRDSLKWEQRRSNAAELRNIRPTLVTFTVCRLRPTQLRCGGARNWKPRWEDNIKSDFEEIHIGFHYQSGRYLAGKLLDAGIPALLEQTRQSRCRTNTCKQLAATDKQTTPIIPFLGKSCW
jgi:hypothetical protein